MSTEDRSVRAVLSRLAPAVVAFGLIAAALLVAAANWWAILALAPTVGAALAWDRHHGEASD